jgi:hypothetical protein
MTTVRSSQIEGTTVVALDADRFNSLVKSLALRGRQLT